MDFEALCKAIGVIVIGLIIIAIPILCGLSFGYNWYGGIKTFLVVLVIIEYFRVVDKISDIK